MRRALLILLTISFFTTPASAQKRKTILGDAFTGVVESTDDATREIKIVNPDKKTETFSGVLEAGYQVTLKDGTKRELNVSELKPGVRVRVFFKSKTQDVAGQRAKVNVINRVQFLGRDSYTRLREMLKVQPSTPVAEAKSRDFPSSDPFKLHLALEPQNLDKALLKFVDQWNKEHSAKYGRVEIVDDVAQADASLIAIWGQDDSFIVPSMLAWDGADLHNVGFGTGYLTIKDENGLHVLWQSSIAVEAKEPQRTAPLLWQLIEKRLKARQK